MTKTQLLFLVILVEGYVVLACELLAIRELIPFVGSGTDVVSIVISAVLLPLAIGYHYGGQAFRKNWKRARAKGKKPRSIRQLLQRNILSAAIIFTLGLSYLLMEIYFALMGAAGFHRLTQTMLYVIVFLVWPVFLLGQTVPLISNYFSRRRLSEITGRMLFFSTAGSFLGSVFSTLILMTFIGVHYTVIITLGLLLLLYVFLGRKKSFYESYICSFLFLVVVMLNGSSAMETMHVVSNNAYNTISIYEVPEDEARLMNINRSTSSKISKNPDKGFPYIRYTEKIFIEPIEKLGAKPRDFLILGAGGFTLGQRDNYNHYTYVDIDPALKTTAEKYFLPEPLGDNKKFIAASARAFVHNTTNTYDFIMVDVYTNIYSIPMEAVTREFLLDIKKLLSKDGILVANVIGTGTMRDKFSVRYNNTFASVFPHYTRQVIGSYLAWPEMARANPSTNVNNLLYIYFHNDYMNDHTIYTDDKNTYSLDRD